jgi:uncharacterized protein YdaU (DUF1376 family)
MKQRPTRMDWFACYPSDFVNSPTVIRMSPTARGAYVFILFHCWLNALKGCSVPDDDEYLMHITKCSKKEWFRVKDIVLSRFVKRDGQLYNERLLEELAIAMKITQTRSDAAGERWQREPNANAFQKDVQSESTSTAPALRLDDSTASDPTQSQSTESVGDVLATMEYPETDEPGALKPGEPGYFRRGQYPGTKPKVVFAHIAKAWSRIRGEAAYCRYPGKYPEAWEMLCQTKSGDLIIPAFELWAVKYGARTQWPVPEFIKVAEEFMTQVIPLNSLRPTLTQEIVDRTNEQALEAHIRVWGTVTEEAGADDLFEEAK